MNLFRLFLLVFFVNNIAYAQFITPEWIDSVPGRYGYSVDVELGPDGYLYSAGALQVDTSYQIAVIKNDKFGNRIWMFQTDTLNGGDFAGSNAIAINNAGFIYVAGYCLSLNHYYDMALFKLDTAGNIVWERFYDGPAGMDDIAYDVAVDTVGNVYITGTRRDFSLKNEIVTIKYDASGNLQWSKFDYVINPSCNMIVYEIKLDELGNVYVAGGEGFIVSPFEHFRALLISYDSNGNLRWRKTYNPVFDYSSYGKSVEIDKNFNAYLSGKASNSTAYIIKYDSTGTEKWLFNHPNSFGNDLELSPNGYLYMTGCWYDTLFNGNWDILLTKLDTSGHSIWSLINGGNGDDYGMRIAVGRNDEVFLNGILYDAVSHYDLTTLKYDSSGTLIWTGRFPNSDCFNSNQKIGSAVDDSGNVYMGSFICPPGPAGFTPVYCTFKYGAQSVGVPEISRENILKVFPNPTSSVLRFTFYPGKEEKISLIIIDASGRIRKSTAINVNPFEINEVTMNTNLEKGIYFLRLTVGKQILSSRFVVMRD